MLSSVPLQRGMGTPSKTFFPKLCRKCEYHMFQSKPLGDTRAIRL